jgi:hypothetical protein
MLNTKKAYDNGSFFESLDPTYSINVIKQDGINELMCNNFTNTLSGAIKFWSTDYKYESPIAIISCDENGYEWLYEQMKFFKFQNAMPSKEKWAYSYGKGIFGSGGFTEVDGKTVLLYWQCIGSSLDSFNTGELKTAPHLFTHSVQAVVATKSDGILTDLPGWFIEGQADYAAIRSLSKTYEDYKNLRSDFFKYAYIPDGDKRKIMKYWGIDEWKSSLVNSPSKFEGIPLIDEYYTGLLAYERMMEKLTHSEMMEFYNKSIQGENFNDVFKIYMGMSPDKFYEDVAKSLVPLSRFINP